jgi:hypothetical protein
MESSREIQECVAFITRHVACVGELVVSSELQQNLLELRSPLLLPELRSVDLADFLCKLAEVRKRKSEKVASRKQMQKTSPLRGYSMIGKLGKGLPPPPRRFLTNRWEYIRNNNWIAKLSENQRQTVFRQFSKLSSHLDADECHVLPAAVKLKVMNQERKVGIHNPLSVATFLAFGYPLTEVDVERTCREPGCVNPIHLIDPRGQPTITAQEDMVSALLKNYRSHGTFGCIFEEWNSKPITLWDADRSGSGGQTVVSSMVIAFMATGRVLDVDTIENQHIVRTCSTLGCSAPNHLSWGSPTKSERGRWLTPRHSPVEHLDTGMDEVFQLLGCEHISVDQCLTLDDAQLERVRHRFRNKWSFESACYRVQTPIKHDGELDTSFILRSIFLAVRGWSVSPHFKYVREERAYRCPKSKLCFNPYHFDSQILFLENEYPLRSNYQFAWQEKHLFASASQESPQRNASNSPIAGTL